MAATNKTFTYMRPTTNRLLPRRAPTTVSHDTITISGFALWNEIDGRNRL